MKVTQPTLQLVSLTVFALFISVVVPVHAFFRDTETAEDNRFIAAGLDAELFVDNSTAESRVLRLGAGSSVSFSYTTHSYVAGSFCSDIQIDVDRHGSDVYDGPIANFTAGPVTLDEAGESLYNYQFSVTDENADYTGKTCQVTIIYDASLDGFDHGEAYFDTEKDIFTLYGGDFGAPPEPTGSVILSEVMYDPPGNDANSGGGEWVEIYNDTGAAIDLTTWTFRESETNHGINTYNGSQYVQPGEYAIIADNPDVFTGEFAGLTNPVFDSSFQMPNNLTPPNPNVLQLKDATDVVVDQMNYPPPGGASGNSHALQLNPGGNWCAALATPGAPNTCGGASQQQVQSLNTFSVEGNEENSLLNEPENNSEGDEGEEDGENESEDQGNEEGDEEIEEGDEENEETEGESNDGETGDESEDADDTEEGDDESEEGNKKDDEEDIEDTGDEEEQNPEDDDESEEGGGEDEGEEGDDTDTGSDNSDDEGETETEVEDSTE